MDRRPWKLALIVVGLLALMVWSGVELTIWLVGALLDALR